MAGRSRRSRRGQGKRQQWRRRAKRGAGRLELPATSHGERLAGALRVSTALRGLLVHGDERVACNEAVTGAPCVTKLERGKRWRGCPAHQQTRGTTLVVAVGIVCRGDPKRSTLAHVPL